MGCVHAAEDGSEFFLLCFVGVVDDIVQNCLALCKTGTLCEA